MNSIKIDVKFPSSSEVEAKLKTVLDTVKKNAVLDFTLDTKAFNSSLEEMSKMLSKLKTQLGKFNILEVDDSKVKKAKKSVTELGDAVEEANKKLANQKIITDDKTGITQTIEKQKVGMAKSVTDFYESINGEVSKHTKRIQEVNSEMFDKIINDFNTRIQSLANNGQFTKNMTTRLQNTVNSFKPDTAIAEVEKLNDKLKSLEGNQKHIYNVKKALEDLKTVLKEATEGSKSEFFKAEDIANVQNHVSTLEKMLAKLNTGKQLALNSVSDTIKGASNSVKELETNASKAETAFNNFKDKIKSYQTDINKLDGENSFNSKAINELQQMLNNLTTKSAVEEFEKLESKINALSNNKTAVNKVAEAMEKLNKIDSRVGTNFGGTGFVNEQDVYKSVQALEKLEGIFKKLNSGELVNKSSIKFAIQEANEAFADMEKHAEQAKQTLENFSKSVEGYQNRIGKLSLEGVHDNGKLDQLQKQLNEFSVDTPKEKIKEFVQELDNLEKNQSNIIKVQKAISDLNKGLEEAKNKQGENLQKADLENVNAQIETLKKLNSELQSGVEKSNTTVNRTIEGAKDSIKTLKDNATQAKKEVENLEAFNNKVIDSQQKLKTMFENGIIDKSALNNLQSQLDKINTDKAVDEIDDFIKKLNDTKKCETDVTSLDKKINDLYNNIKTNKTKFGEELLSKAGIKQTEEELLKLVQVSEQLKRGKLIDGNAVRSQINVVDNSLKQVVDSAKNSAQAIRMNQTEVTSLGRAFQTTLSKFGIYATTAMAVRKLFNEFKQGVEDVIALDKAMTTLKITMQGMTDTGLSNLTVEAQQLATELKSTTTTVLEAITTFANMGETLESIMNKTGSAVILTNLTGLGIQTSVDTIQSATMQFESLADGSEESAMKVADSMVAISKAMGLDFATGVSGMAESLNILGSLADQAKMDIDQTLALIGSGMEKLRLSGSEVATAFKTIISRTMRVKDGENGSEEFLKAEEALNSLGIAIKDQEGNMRAFMDIMYDLNGMWGDLTEQQQTYVADAMGKEYCPLVA